MKLKVGHRFYSHLARVLAALGKPSADHGVQDGVGIGIGPEQVLDQTKKIKFD